MAAISEVAQTPVFRIKIGAERRRKTLAQGFINEDRSALVLMERPRSIEVFPGMLGAFTIPAGSIKYRKFLDY